MVDLFSILGFLVGVFFISISLIRLKKQSIAQSTFVIWVFVGIVIAIIALIPSAIFSIQAILGTEFILSAVFGIAFLFLAGLVFYLHQKVDMTNQRITKLLAELGTYEFYKSSSNKDE